MYTDLSKAFNKLDHKLLLSTFNSFGFSGNLISFFSSYIKDRLQYIDCNGFKSRQFAATSGVPQGWILGPLFICMFINIILNNLGVECILHAEDLKRYSIVWPMEDCIDLQVSLEQVYTTITWLLMYPNAVLYHIPWNVMTSFFIIPRMLPRFLEKTSSKTFVLYLTKGFPLFHTLTVIFPSANLSLLLFFVENLLHLQQLVLSTILY